MTTIPSRLAGRAAPAEAVPAPVGNLSTAPTQPPVFGSPPDRDMTRPLDLDAIIHETETGRFMVGVGVNSDAGLVGQITIDERNFDLTRVPTSWEDVRDGTPFAATAKASAWNWCPA